MILQVQLSLSIKNQFLIFQIPLQIGYLSLWIFSGSFLDSIPKCKNAKQEKCQPPPFKKTCPCTILLPSFLIFQTPTPPCLPPTPPQTCFLVSILSHQEVHVIKWINTKRLSNCSLFEEFIKLQLQKCSLNIVLLMIL